MQSQHPGCYIFWNMWMSTPILVFVTMHITSYCIVHVLLTVLVHVVCVHVCVYNSYCKLLNVASLTPAWMPCISVVKGCMCEGYPDVCTASLCRWWFLTNPNELSWPHSMIDFRISPLTPECQAFQGVRTRRKGGCDRFIRWLPSLPHQIW